MPVKKITVWLLLTFVVCGILYFSWGLRPFPRRALPWNATQVDDMTWGTFFEPSYMLKAKISFEQYEEYRILLGCTELAMHKLKLYNNNSHWYTIEIEGEDTKSWWDPNNSLENTYYSPSIGIEHSRYRIIKYEDGYVYFVDY